MPEPIKLQMLSPSVNNLSVRVFLRAAGLPFEEVNAWGATRTTLVAYVIPVVGIVLGYLALQEPVDGRLVIGTVLVIGGVAFVNSRFGRRRLFGRVPPAEPA